MTVWKLLEEYERRYGGRKAFCHPDAAGEKEVSAEEFCRHVRAAAAFFRDKCREGGQHVGLIGENSYPYLAALFGIICSGNVAVPFNQNYGREALAACIRRAEVSLLLCEEAYREDFGIPADRVFPLDITMTGNGTSIPHACKNALTDAGKKGQEDDVALMLHSSGTSGNSKLVQITHRSLSAFPAAVLEEMGKGSGRDGGKGPLKTMMALPFYHIGGITPLLGDMMRGNITYISSAKYMLRDMEHHAFDRVVVVPAMMKRILWQCERQDGFRKQCGRLKEALCLGAALTEDLIARMRALSIEPEVYYGMTETTGTVSGFAPYKTGACGKPAPYCQVRIAEDGEILVRGDNIMKGYFGNAAETRSVLEDGWLHTGDLGGLDEEGYLFVRGRKKNIIILSNGENVSPEELEGRLSQCRYVEECRVFGGEDRIKAEIYCTAHGGEGAEEAVREFVRRLNRQLPPSQKIKECIFAERELARNSMGKLLR